MKVIKSFAWDFYKNDNSQDLDEEKVGKWMYFFEKKI